MKQTKVSVPSTGRSAIPYVTALATLAAPASADAIVQITLQGNFLSSDSGNHLDADFTGDGIADYVFGATDAGVTQVQDSFDTLFFANATVGSFMANANHREVQVGPNTFNNYSFGGAAFIGGVLITAGATTLFSSFSAPRNGGSASVTALFPITFTDARYGTGVQAFVQVRAFGAGGGSGSSARIDFLRLIWDENDTGSFPDGLSAGDSAYPEAPVPEPSTLALLALGAAGVLARRRRS